MKRRIDKCRLAFILLKVAYKNENMIYDPHGWVVKGGYIQEVQ